MKSCFQDVPARFMIDVAMSPLMVVPPVIAVISRLAVGVALPVLRMAGGHVRVDRTGNDHGCGPDHDRVSVYNRLCVNGRRRKIADVHVKTRLADADGEAHIGCVCCGSS